MSCTIGICAAIEEVRWGPWEDVATMLPRSYSTAVQRSGGVALLVPPDETVARNPDIVLDRIDAVLLAGGSDVDPACYGEPPHSQTQRTWPERDRFELALTRRALERDMPLLGICRGMQILNVALGGTLVQHLPDVIGHEAHRDTPGWFGDHEVRLEPGSLAAKAAGGDRITVKSHHHQGIDRMGDGLIPSGWSVADDLVEAVELRDDSYVLGVLWHPEEDGQSQVVASLVAATQAEVGAP